MNKLIAILLIFAGSLKAIEGNYNVTGYDPYDKKNYNGTATIAKDKNDVYQIKWNMMTTDGKKYSYTGTGLKTGNDVNFVFTNTSVGQEEIGLQTYKINDKTLEGPFVLLNKNLVGKEKLIKQG